MSCTHDVVHFDYATYKRFRLAYLRAVKSGAQTFLFEGKEFLVSYAKYVLEYLETRYE